VSANVRTYGLMIGMYLSRDAKDKTQELFIQMKQNGWGGDISLEEIEKLHKDYSNDWIWLLPQTYTQCRDYGIRHVKTIGKYTIGGFKVERKADVNIEYIFKGRKVKQRIIGKLRQQLGVFISRDKVEAFKATKPSYILLDESGLIQQDLLDDWFKDTVRWLEKTNKKKKPLKESEDPDVQVVQDSS